MINVPKSWPIEEYRDIESLNFYRAMTDPARSADGRDRAAEPADVMRSLQILGRDNARLPMQWSGEAPHAGFTDGGAEPWIRVHDLYKEINVERQVRDGEGSVLGFWKRMIRFRKEHAIVLVHGAFEGFGMEDKHTFVFGKRGITTGGAAAGENEERAAVVLNFTGEEQEVELPSGAGYEGLVFAVGSYEDAVREEESAKGRVRKLRPWEGRLYLSGC